VHDAIRRLQAARVRRSEAQDCGQPALFIAVDQEGGTVARSRHPFTQFAGNPHIHTKEQAMEFARVTARELADMGINMNMAPVLDVAPPGGDSIMKKRVFPGDHALVSDLGGAMISTFQSFGVMAVAKHFPGIGRTIKDSHFSLPILDAELDTLKTSDIKPFEAALESGVAGMMLSHISYPRLDPAWQASLSPAIARDLLRRELGYNGMILTDDMDMKAIGHDIETCMAQVLAADIDIALICHEGPNIKRAWDTILGLLETHEDLFEQGRSSVERIMAAKNRYLG